MNQRLLMLAILALLSAVEVRSDGSDHRYKSGDPVPLYANKVGPFHNPRYPFLSDDLMFMIPLAVSFLEDLIVSRLQFCISLNVCVCVLESDCVVVCHVCLGRNALPLCI